MTYEQAMERLEEIVSQLSNQSISLENSLELYAEGAKLVSFCNETLKQAEQKIEMLTKNGEADE